MIIQSTTCAELNLQLDAGLRDIIERLVARKSKQIIGSMLSSLKDTDVIVDEISRSQEALVIRLHCNEAYADKLKSTVQNTIGE